MYHWKLHQGLFKHFDKILNFYHWRAESLQYSYSIMFMWILFKYLQEGKVSSSSDLCVVGKRGELWEPGENLQRKRVCSGVEAVTLFLWGKAIKCHMYKKYNIYKLYHINVQKSQSFFGVKATEISKVEYKLNYQVLHRELEKGQGAAPPSNPKCSCYDSHHIQKMWRQNRAKYLILKR